MMKKILKKQLKSVVDQDYKNIQYIVIDGNSNDNSVSIINNYSKRIDTFISEPDKGIYDAFNKGLSYAKGDLIGFVNSGDLLTAKSLSYLNYYYNKYRKADFFFGSVKKHWGTLYGYKRWKIFLRGAFIPAIQRVFY